MKKNLLLLLLSSFFSLVCNPKSLFIVCGETSGDRLGAWYAQQYQQENDDATIHAVGGTFLEQVGAHCCLTLDEIEQHNLRLITNKHFFDLFSKPTMIYDCVKKIASLIQEKQPDEIALVDFPCVNMFLLLYLSYVMPSIPITYISPPHLWVHGRWGIQAILRKTCSNIIVLYPFEKHGIKKTVDLM